MTFTGWSVMIFDWSWCDEGVQYKPNKRGFRVRSNDIERVCRPVYG